MRKKIFDQIAIELGTFLGSQPAGDLPSIDSLAERFGVSYVTMWKSLRLLERKGTIRKMPSGRRRAAMAGSTGGDDRSAGQFALKMQAGILDGTIRAGQALPKIEHLVRQQGISPNTVCRGLQKLAAANLAHKSGKQWIAGPRPRPAALARERNDNRPVVLLLAGWEPELLNFFRVQHTGMFARQFRQELLGYGINLTPAKKHQQALNVRGIPTGPAEIADYIRRLGSRYAGTLIAETALAYEPEMWAHELLRHDKPVVVFDAANRLSDVNIRRRKPKSGYFRLFLDEPGAVRCMLGHLASLGHARIGTINLEPEIPQSWATRRIGLIEQTASDMDPRLSVSVVHQADPGWSPQWDQNNEIYFSEVFQESQPLPRAPDGRAGQKARQKMFARNPRFLSLLHDGISAILALNDYAAMNYAAWFKVAGIDVPGEISLAGFDNLPETLIYPVTTVDFGFLQLGYLAAHILIGDIPIHADPQGNIPGKITLIDNGSTSAPAPEALMRKIQP